jgi:hypothetical protein
MSLKNFSLSLLLCLFALTSFAQSSKLPADFTLSYLYKAGMLPQSESLEIDKEGGKYKSENKDKTKEKSLKRTDAGIAKLYTKLQKTGVFTVKRPPAVMKPEELYMDESTEKLVLSANAQTFHFNLNRLKEAKYSEEDIEKIKKAKELIRNYCKTLNK